MEVGHLIFQLRGQRGEEASGDEKSRQVRDVSKDLLRVKGVLQVRIAEAAASTHLDADHAVHHLGVAVAPLVHVLIDVSEDVEEASRELEHRLFLIEHDHERRGGRTEPEPSLLALDEVLMDITVIDRLELLVGVRQFAEKGSALLRFQSVVNVRTLDFEHLFNCLLVALLEIVAAELAEGNVSQPALDIVK